MTQVAFVIPGDLALPTGGYAYARHLIQRFAAQAISCTHVSLPGSFPAPTDADLAETERKLAELPATMPLLFDGLAYGALPGDLVARIRQPIVALVHHPLCLEAGLSPMRQRVLQQTETMALAFAAHVVATSPTTARLLSADFAVPAARLTVAEPGTARAPRATGTWRHDGTAPIALLAVGSIVPRKGYDMLMHALGGVADRAWTLDIAGAVRDPAALAAFEAARDAHGLASRVFAHGAVTDAELDRLFARADIFLMPSHFEGYGMVLAEAQARGLPIVCTTGGAAAETVPDDAAIKVAPGDARAFGAGVGRLIGDPALRRAMADAAHAAGQRLPTWDDATRIVATALKRAAA